jgi:hypothetical protein
MGRPCSTNGEKRNVYRLLAGKPEGKRSLGRPRRRWADIRMDLGEVGWGDVVIQYRCNLYLNRRHHLFSFVIKPS